MRAYVTIKSAGVFIKRDGRPSKKETPTSRLIDRHIRPLFPEGYMNEVQVVCTVMYTCKTVDPDIPAMIGTSEALAVSGIPFAGQIGTARVSFTPTQGNVLIPSYDASNDIDQ